MNYAIQSQNLAQPLHSKRLSKRGRRQRLMLQGSALGVAVTMGATIADEAAAQTVPSVAPRQTDARSVQAASDLTPAAGTHTTSPTRDVVTVNNPATIINWNTFDQLTLDQTTDYVNFLPNETEVIFVGQTAGYVVLNRIFSAPDASGKFRGVAFNGTVTSRIGNSDSGAIGGNIWFYSPGGILAGGKSVFNVGSLLLTTSNVETIDNVGKSATFRGVADPGSSIFVQGGASINAGQEGSYVAMFAPRIDQDGTVQVNGSTLYGAGEQGTLMIEAGNGLLDLSITVGSEDSNGINHTGETGGVSSGALNDNHVIQLVTVPKNKLMTMLVGGDIGYQPATVAGVRNGQVILTARAATESAQSNIDVGDTKFTSNTAITAEEFVQFSADGQDALIIVDDGTASTNLSITAGSQIDFEAINGGNIDVNGVVTLDARGGSAGGRINITANDGSRNAAGLQTGIRIGQSLNVSTAAFGNNGFGANGVGGDAAGGIINVSISSGGDLLVDSQINLDSSATAGFGLGQSGDAVAGTINFDLSGSNSVVTSRNLLLSSNANGASNPNTSGPRFGAIGGDGQSGDVSLSVADGQFEVGNLTINADANASGGSDFTRSQSNDAQSRAVSVQFEDTAVDFTDFRINARNIAADSFDAAGNTTKGAVNRPLVSVTTDAAVVQIGESLNINASTSGDISGVSSANAISLTAVGGGQLGTKISTSLDASHTNSNSRNAGEASGILISADGGGLALNQATLDTRATLGSGATEWQDLTGGDITIETLDSGDIDFGVLDAQSGVFNALGLTGRGNSRGGDISLLADAGTIGIANTATLNTSVDGGVGGDQSGRTSRAGNISLVNSSDASGMSFGSLQLLANAAITGGEASRFVGDGGNGTGGDISITVDAEDISVTGQLNAESIGTGSVGGILDAGGGQLADGGDGRGGNISISVEGGDLNANGIIITAGGVGGAGSDSDLIMSTSAAGDSGDAFGGTIDIQIISGTLNADGGIRISASAETQNGGDALGGRAGDAGTATGGLINFNQTGGTFSSASNQLELNAFGIGGDGGAGTPGFDGGSLLVLGEQAGAGGDGVGGDVSYSKSGGSTNVTEFSLDGSGVGGVGGEYTPQSAFSGSRAGGNGGNGSAGDVSVTLGQNDAVPRTYNLSSLALGGDGGAGLIGGDGGAANSGSATLSVVDAGVTVDTASFEVRAVGGAGGMSTTNGGAGGQGGDAVAGDVLLSATGDTAEFASNGPLTINAVGFGRVGGSGAANTLDSGIGGQGGSGGAGTGGDVTISAVNGATLNYLVDGVTNVTGIGGAGGAGGMAPLAVGGAGGSGGDTQGGSVTLIAASGGTLIISGNGSAIEFDASAAGSLGGNGGVGAGGSVADLGANGAASGGAVSIFSSDSKSQIGFANEVTLDVSATGAVDNRISGLPQGGDATGGAAKISASNGGLITVNGGLSALAFARAGLGSALAGTGTGGAVDLIISDAGSRIDVLGQFAAGRVFEPAGSSLYVDVSAYEANSASSRFGAAAGRDTSGGAIRLNLSDGATNVAGDIILTSGSGVDAPNDPGSTALAQFGKQAKGGSVTVNLTDSTHVWGGDFTATVTTSSLSETSIIGTIDVKLDNANIAIGNDNSFKVVSQTFGRPQFAAPADETVVDVQLLNGSSISAESVSAIALSESFAAQGGAIVAGDVSFLLDNSALTAAVTTIRSEASRTGLLPNTGVSAASGDVNFSALNGSVVQGLVSLENVANSDAGPSGGDAVSGDISYVLNDSQHQRRDLPQSVQILSQASAGGAFNAAGTGGDATTGTVTMTVSGTSNFLGNVQINRVISSVYEPSGVGGIGNLTTGATNINLLGGVFDSDSFNVNIQSLQSAALAGPGGNAIVGDLTLNIAKTNVDINALTLETGAMGGLGAAGAVGGSATSGDITITHDPLSAETVNLGEVTLTGSAEGGAGGTGTGRDNGGAGGTATSSDIAITGEVNFTSLTIENNATGGIGGASGITAIAGVGGNATTGNFTLGTTGNLPNTTLIAYDGIAQGGAGGTGVNSGDGGAGGSGTSGTAELNLTGTGALLGGTGTIDLDASASGGSGGDGGDVSGFGSIGGQGGIGGNAQAGGVTVNISGAGATLTVDSSTSSLNVDANGGMGGSGGSDSFGVGAGSGAQGGNAGAGTVTLAAGSGSTISLFGPGSTPFDFSANGMGGNGGFGGIGTGGSVDDFPGDGANGGTGNGGSLILRAVGGTITGDAGDLAAIGTGGTGGGAGGALADNGNGGNGLGGIVLLEVLDGSPGVISLGDIVIDASGIGGGGDVTGDSTGGQITLRDASVEDGGLIILASLDATATGLFAPGSPSFTMTGGSGPITIIGDMQVDVAGDILLAFDADGRLRAGGDITLDADGGIDFQHSNNGTNIVSIDSGGDLTANAGGNFLQAAGNIAEADGTLAVRAEGSAGSDDLRAGDRINLSAGLGNTARNLTTTEAARVVGGVIQNGISIKAGSNEDQSFEQFAANQDVSIMGDITSTGRLDILAGGDVNQAALATARADNGVRIESGDDIIVDGVISSGSNPATTPSAGVDFDPNQSTLLLAGAINDGSRLIGAPNTPIASIAGDGTILSAFGVRMSANAIELLGASVTGLAVSADIADAPATGAARSDDGGLLSGSCLEGDICIGGVFASDRFEIGQNSNNDVVNFLLNRGDITADSVLISTRNNLTLREVAGTLNISAADEFVLDSVEGDISLTDVEITSAEIRIDAGGSLTGNGSLTSANDIGITVGQNLSAALIDTGGQLTSATDVGGALEAQFNTPGDFIVNSYTQTANPIAIVAGGDAILSSIFGDDASITAADIRISRGTITGDLALVSTVDDITVLDAIAAGGSITVDSADFVGFNALNTQSGDITVTAGSGVSFNDATSAGDLTIDAARGVFGGDLSADGAIDIDAQSVSISTASGATIAIDSDTDVSFNILTSDDTIDVTALTGAVSKRNVGGGFFTGEIIGGLPIGPRPPIDGGDLTSGGDVTFSAESYDLRDINAGGDFLATASDGDAVFETVNVSGDGRVSGNNITATSGTIGGSLTLDAVAGDINILGDMNVGSSVDLGATGRIDFQSIAAGSDFTVVAVAGDVTFVDATTSNDNLTIIASGDISGREASNLDLIQGDGQPDNVNLIAGGDITLTNRLRAEDLILVDAGGQFTAPTLDAGALDIAATGLIQVGSSIQSLANQGASFTGASVELTDVDANGNVSIASVTGEISISGTSDANGTTTLNSAGDISGGGIVTSGGALDLTAVGTIDLAIIGSRDNNVSADAGGAIAFDEANAGADLQLTTVSTVTGGDVDAVGTAAIDAARIVIGDGSAGTIDFTSGSDILFDILTSTNAIDLNASSGSIGANTGSGTITSDDDVTLTAQVIALGNIDSGGTVAAGATLGSAALGNVTAADDIAITAVGAASLTGATSGGDTNVTGESVSLQNGNVAGDLVLNATDSDLDATGALTVSGGIDLDAAGAITIGTLDAQGGAFTADAGSTIDFTDIAASTDIAFNATGQITGGDADAGGDLGLNASNIVIGDGSGDSISLSSDSDILFDEVTSPNAISLIADGGMIAANTGAGNVDSGGDVTLMGQEIDLGLVGAAGDIDAASAIGTLTINTLDSGGTITLDAPLAIIVDSADAVEDFLITGGDSFTSGSSAINAGGDIIIDMVGTVDLGNASANGLIDVAGEQIDFATLQAGQTIELLTTLTQGAGNGDITGTNLTAGAGESSVTSGFGSIDISGASTAGGSLDLIAANNATFGTATAQNGDLTVEAGNAVSFTAADAASDLTITAGGPLTGGDAAADGALALSGADVAIGAGSGDTIMIDSGSNIAFDMLTSPNAITLSAITGSITDNGDSGDIDGGDDVTLVAGEIALGNIAAEGSVEVSAAAGDASFASVTANDSITVASSGTPIIGALTSGGDTSVTGASVDLSQASIGGDLIVTATTGDVDVTGDATAGAGIDLDAAGDVTFGDLTAQSGDFNADAGGAITGGTVNSSGDITLIGGATIATGDLTAGGDVTGDASGDFSAGNITQTGGVLDISADGAVMIADAAGSDNAAIAALGSVQFTNIASDGAATLSSQDNISGTAVGTGGSISIDGANVAITDIAASSGDIAVSASSGAVTTGTVRGPANIVLSADGIVTADIVDAGQDAAINAGGAVLGTVTAVDGFTAQIDGATGLAVDTLIAGNAVSINSASGPIAVADTLVAGGNAELVTDGSLMGGTITSGADLQISAAEIDLAAVSAAGNATLFAILGNATVGSANAGETLAIGGNDGVTVADAVGNSVRLRSTQGAVLVTNDLASTGTGLVILTGEAIQIDDVNDVEADTLFAGDGDIEITAVQNITLADAQAVGDIRLTSTEGGVSVERGEAGDVVGFSSMTGSGIGTAAVIVGSPGDGSITIDAAQNVSASLFAATTIDVIAGNEIRLNESTANDSIELDSGASTLISGEVQAGTDIAVSSGAVVDIVDADSSLEAGNVLGIVALDRFRTAGLASGTQASITASDIEITDSGQLGDATATINVTLANQGADVILGGDGATGASTGGSADGFAVDADEFTRIFSGGDLAVNAVGGMAGDALVTVDSFTIIAGDGSTPNAGNIGSDGTFSITADGGINVVGALDLTQAGESTRLALNASDDIRLRGDGNLRIEDANGDLVGFLGLNAPGIAVGDDDALGDIDNSTLADLDERFGQPTAAPSDEGFLQADNISFTVSDYLLVQNTGQSDSIADRRGFTANEVNISTNATGDVVGFAINGVIGGATGADTVPLANIQGQFDQLSTINGCAIGDPSSCIPIIVTPIDMVSVATASINSSPTQDLIREEIEEENDQPLAADPIGSMLVMLNDPNTDEDDPMIDDAVTGAGNDDLWNGIEEEDCDPAGDGSCSTESGQGELEPAE